jgi:hypothetical protein
MSAITGASVSGDTVTIDAEGVWYATQPVTVEGLAQGSSQSASSVTINSTTSVTIGLASTADLSVGDSVTVSGVLGCSGVNGTWTIASLVANTSITVTTTAASDTLAGGLVTGGSSPQTITGITINSATSVTLDIASTAGLADSQTVTISAITGATGINGVWQIASLVTNTSITITTTAASNTPSGGTVAGSGWSGVNGNQTVVTGGSGSFTCTVAGVSDSPNYSAGVVFPTLIQDLPDWGQFVAGKDTLQYYVDTAQDTADTEEYWFEQKVANPTADHEYWAESVNAHQGYPGTSGASTSADINLTPGYTSGATPA